MAWRPPIAPLKPPVKGIYVSRYRTPRVPKPKPAVQNTMLPVVNRAPDVVKGAAKTTAIANPIRNRITPGHSSIQGVHVQPFRQTPQALDPSKHLINAEGNLVPTVGKPFDPGYDKAPTFWEDPKHVAQAYNQLQSLLPGEAAPEWMDTESIKQAYKYLSFANGNESSVNWKYLAPDDPGRQWLQSIPTPPIEDLLDPSQYNKMKFYEVLDNPEKRTPEIMQSFDQRQLFALQSYDDAKARDAWINAHTPAWMRITQQAMSNPVVAGLAQTDGGYCIDGRSGGITIRGWNVGFGCRSGVCTIHSNQPSLSR
jgi:hypothetical protein